MRGCIPHNQLGKPPPIKEERIFNTTISQSLELHDDLLHKSNHFVASVKRETM